MSKSSKSKGGRDSSAIASGLPLPRPHEVLRSVFLDEQSSGPTLGQDRRTFSPSPFATRTNAGRPTRLIAKPLGPRKQARSQRLSYKPGYLPYSVAFSSPRSVAICVRRGIRKEVLHALGISGRRGLGRGRGGSRRTVFSKIRC